VVGFEVWLPRVQITDHVASGNRVWIMVWIPIAIEYIVGVNIKMPTGKEVRKNGRW
jgi:hypothetical protein